MRGLIRFGLGMAAAALPLTGGVGLADRGPSTQEERARAVELVQDLERDPFGPDAPEARRWLIEWTIEIPDISVKLCGEFMRSAIIKTYPYSSEVGLHPLFAATRFAIEHPDRASDDNAMYLAEIEGTLHVYELVLKSKPDARLKELDDLVAKRDDGKLKDYVAKTAKKKCKS